MEQEYDLELVTIAIDGDILTGFATGGKCSLKRNTDRVTPVVGCDGHVVYARSADKSGTCEINLTSTSASLRKLRQNAMAGRQVNLSVMDANREESVRVNCSGCVITSVPEAPRQQQPTDVTVTVYVPRLEFK